MSDRPESSRHRHRSRSPDRERVRDSHRRSRSPERESSRRRSRSRSPARRRSRSPTSHRSSNKSSSSRHKRREKEEDSGSEEEGGPPSGVAEIDEGDYFLKSTELKVWLDEVKRKRLDQLSGDDARRYFKKFCKSWNRGRLDSKFYAGISAASISASASSGHAWSFSKASQRELDDAASVRKSIEGNIRAGASSSTSSGPRVVMGPSFPPPPSGSAVSALQDSREAKADAQMEARDARKAGYRKDARESREEERDNRSTGRERLMEKRREVGAANKEIRDGREGGGMMEVSEDVLMGSGGSFAAMVAARDNRRPTKKMQAQEEKAALMSDKLREHRTKEDSTMAMFKNLAAARFG